ncbi:hypothetical protein IHE44_0001735 [Lamprotornis superbus]|uniref:Ras-GEF domain-containing family member 1A n=1 Tax=Lamprotornis superbus TaxID=245042 RepID=A0A835NSW6_9PASS|nr:hypothetical protein IHE44_0001735 [Lamprotornis superbus]
MVKVVKDLSSQETMPQTPIFSSMLGSSCSGQVQPDMGERCVDPVYQDGNLVSGSLEALIERLVPTMDYYPDRTYIFTFLLSSRVFIHPHELLAKVGQICIKQKQQLETGTEAEKAKLKSFAAKIIQLLKEWTETFPYDFQDEKSMKELKEIAHRITQCDETGFISGPGQNESFWHLVHRGSKKPCANSSSTFHMPAAAADTDALEMGHYPKEQTSQPSKAELGRQAEQCQYGVVWENGTVKKIISQMTQNLLMALSARSQYQEIREKFRQPVTDKGTILKTKPQSTQKDILSVCCDPLILAQQLTYIELCRSDVTKTYNLEAYDNWFNCLSMLVATEICRFMKEFVDEMFSISCLILCTFVLLIITTCSQQVVKKKQRTRMVEFFIDVARECFNIGNFNSMMAIISGMNLSPVARLKKTWSKVKTAKFDVLEHHMDPSSNFCNYRTALQGAAQRSQTANSNREKIVIPVFNLFIKDIYFLHKIHTNRLPNGQINFKKFWEISRQIHDFLTWKQVECPFEKDKKIQTYLLTAPIYSEEALFIASFESEGPENHMEKDSWKTLRAKAMVCIQALGAELLSWCVPQQHLTQSPPRVAGPSPHGLAVSPVGLLAQVRLDLVPEHQHAQVRVRRLVHGLGLDAHAVLLRGQLVRAVLLVPQVEQPRHRRPHHHQLPVQVLPVQVNVLAAPALHLQVKAPCKTAAEIVAWAHGQEEQHFLPKVLLDLIYVWQTILTTIFHILAHQAVLSFKNMPQGGAKHIAEDSQQLYSTSQATAVEEFGCEININITEEHQDLALLPGSGTHVKSSASVKFLIQRDKRVSLLDAEIEQQLQQEAEIKFKMHSSLQKGRDHNGFKGREAKSFCKPLDAYGGSRVLIRAFQTAALSDIPESPVPQEKDPLPGAASPVKHHHLVQGRRTARTKARLTCPYHPLTPPVKELKGEKAEPEKDAKKMLMGARRKKTIQDQLILITLKFSHAFSSNKQAKECLFGLYSHFARAQNLPSTNASDKNEEMQALL